MSKTLKELRKQIIAEKRYVDRKPYSHNIISIALHIIADKFGKEEANKTIRDFKLNKLGWKEE